MANAHQMVKEVLKCVPMELGQLVEELEPGEHPLIESHHSPSAVASGCSGCSLQPVDHFLDTIEYSYRLNSAQLSSSCRSPNPPAPTYRLDSVRRLSSIGHRQGEDHAASLRSTRSSRSNTP